MRERNSNHSERDTMTIRDLMNLPEGVVLNGRTGKEYNQAAQKPIQAIHALHNTDGAEFGSSEYWERLEAVDKAIDAYLSRPSSALEI